MSYLFVFRYMWVPVENIHADFHMEDPRGYPHGYPRELTPY